MSEFVSFSSDTQMLFLVFVCLLTEFRTFGLSKPDASVSAYTKDSYRKV